MTLREKISEAVKDEIAQQLEDVVANTARDILDGYDFSNEISTHNVVEEYLEDNLKDIIKDDIREEAKDQLSNIDIIEDTSITSLISILLS